MISHTLNLPRPADHPNASLRFANQTPIEVRNSMSRIGSAFSAITLAMFVFAACHAEAQERVIYSFSNNGTDGATPRSNLIFDSQGNLFGTTSAGGADNGYGTVFELSPQGDGSWKETILYSFPGELGGVGPSGGLIFDSSGNLYGLATGSEATGEVYELSPPVTSGGMWTQTVLYSFLGSPDGEMPVGNLIFDQQGNLYGVTSSGGNGIGDGTVFELTPGSKGIWTEKVIFTFTGSSTGYSPMSGLIFDGDGNLYGTAGGGGSGFSGVLYELSPPSPGTTWNETVIWNFAQKVPAEGGPTSSLIFDTKGNLYGTTGGQYPGWGTVFEMSPPALSGGAWTELTLYSFVHGAADGYQPEANVIFDADGDLWGTTISGGPNLDAVGDSKGSIFELTPHTGGTWTEDPAYFFGTNTNDGYETSAGLIEDSKGNFYGTSPYGGNGTGTVFEFTPLPTAATPTFSPDPGSFTTVQSVEISDITPDALIYYTTNGTTPTVQATKYSGAISVSTPQTIKAIATASGYNNSAISSAIYTVNLPIAATPTFNPLPGTYTGAQMVSLSDTTKGATIYYSTNGFPPTTSSTVYTEPILVSASETILANSTAPNYATSATAIGTYNFNAAAPAISPQGGTFSTPQTVTITDSTPGVTVYYTTNATAPTSASAKYTAPIEISTSQTVEAIAIGGGLGNSQVATAKFTFEPATPPPTFVLKPGTYPGTQLVALKDAIAGATIYYNSNGKSPVTSPEKYSAPIVVRATETIQAVAIAPGHAVSTVVRGIYTIEKPAATPAFSLKAGKYAMAQTVKITDSTKGAVICYTTNGKTPTTASAKYSAPIKVAADETVKAIAVAKGFATSAVASAVYTIETATPTISPNGGTFTKVQTVTIKDVTAGAAIYYTINGTAPTAKSTKYSQAFKVSASETVKVMAIATDHAESAVASAEFTIP